MAPVPPLSFRSAVLALLVFGALGLYSLYDVLDGPGTARQERIAKSPTLPATLQSVPRFVADTRFHIKNRYALKDTFVQANGAVKMAAFGHSATADVHLGQDGFLFFGVQNAIRQIQGLDRLTPAETTAWSAHFETTAQVFDDLDLPFVFVIGPNKHSFYTEALPDWIVTAPPEDRRSRDILDTAEGRMTPPPVDARAVLQDYRDAHPGRLLYYKTDTHWNELGAAVTLHSAFARIGVALPAPVATEQTLPRSGDLARMLGQQQVIPETAPVLETPVQWACFGPDNAPLTVETIDPLMPPRFSCRSDAPDDRVVVAFIDSFGVSAIPFLASSFQRVEFIWRDTVDPGVARDLQADIVVQILVERKLQDISPETLLVRP